MNTKTAMPWPVGNYRSRGTDRRLVRESSESEVSRLPLPDKPSQLHHISTACEPSISFHTVPRPGNWRTWQLKVWLATRLALAARGVVGHRSPAGFGVLTYHRVADGVMGDSEMLNVTPQRFWEQMSGLLALGYEPWPLRRLVDVYRNSGQVPPRAFAVVFDDGYENTYRNAWPVLEQLRIPATIFLATAYLDTDRPFPFDTWAAGAGRNSAPDCWRPLATEQCQKMLEEQLIDIGTHTHTHQDFRERPAEFGRDLRTSLDWLQDRLGLDRVTFSYPFGLFTKPMSCEARDAGVLCGLTMQSELVRTSSDPFLWGRFGAVQSDTAAMLAAKLDGWYSIVQSTWWKLSGKSGRVH